MTRPCSTIGSWLPACLAFAGCVRMVPIKDRQLTPLDEHNAPVTMGAHGDGTFHCTFALRGRTRTFSYDSLPWRFARMPFIRSSDGIPILLDTGLGDPARATLDVVSRKGWPAHLGKPFDFAYVPSLELGGITASEVPAVLIDSQYQVRLLGVPLYRTSGIVMGNALLAQAAYVSFDNRRREVTIGFEPYVPSSARVWNSYPFDGNGKPVPSFHGGSWPPNLQPWIHLPVAGKTIHLIPDSAGGPHLILNRPQWNEIAPSLVVRGHRVDRYPTWGGFQTVDRYRVASLPVGPLRLKNEIVWVRRGEMREQSPLMGLGMFQSETLVWDFRRRLFWIGW